MVFSLGKKSIKRIPTTAKTMPMYWATEILSHSLKNTIPISIVKIVNSESRMPEVTVTPIFAVTSPKDINTSGESARSNGNHMEYLFPSFAQIALTEFADSARATAIAMYNSFEMFCIKYLCFSVLMYTFKMGIQYK